MDFDFYQWILYRDKAGYPNDPVKVGRWLGISHHVGSPLTFWILKGNGQIISRSTVIPLEEGQRELDQIFLPLRDVNTQLDQLIDDIRDDSSIASQHMDFICSIIVEDTRNKHTIASSCGTEN